MENTAPQELSSKRLRFLLAGVAGPQAMIDFVAEWLQAHEDNGTLWDIGGVGGSVAEEWRKEMSGDSVGPETQ